MSASGSADAAPLAEVQPRRPPGVHRAGGASLPLLHQPAAELEVMTGRPSVGSILHGRGECQPCGWVWKPGGCQNGDACARCHLCPPSELKARKKAKKQMHRLAYFATSQGLAHAGEGSQQTPPPEPTASTVPPPPPGLPLPCRRRSPLVAESPAFWCKTTFEDLDPDSTASTAASGAEELQDLSCSSEGSEQLPSSEPSSEELHEDDGPGTVRRADGTSLPIPPGLAPPPGAPSHGSALHGSGTCRPCGWFWKPGGCRHDVNCSYCHVCPAAELRARKKSKHAQMRQGLVTPEATPFRGCFAIDLAALL